MYKFVWVILLSFISIHPLLARDGVASSASDYEGSYQWSGRNVLNGLRHPNEGKLIISRDPSNPETLLIKGFEYGSEDGLKATFDPTTGRLVIPNQFAFFSEDFGYDVWFQNWTLENITKDDGTPGYYPVEAPSTHPFYFILEDKDTLKAGDIDMERWENHEYTDAELLEVCCVACDRGPGQQGYVWMCLNVIGKRLIEKEDGENSVEDVIGDTSSPTYFNLQGIKIEKPLKNHIYIEVNGRKARTLLYNR